MKRKKKVMKIHKKIIVISILTTMLVTFYLPNISKVEGTGTDTGLSPTGDKMKKLEHNMR